MLFAATRHPGYPRSTSLLNYMYGQALAAKSALPVSPTSSPPYPPNCWNTTGPVQPYAARAAHAVRHDPSPRVPPPLRHSLLNWPVKASGKGMLFPSPPPPRTRSLLTTLSLPTAGTPPGLYSSKRARGRQVLLPSPLPLTTSLPSNRGNASPPLPPPPLPSTAGTPPGERAR